MTGAKATFQAISSIYVYSLQPTVLEDLNVLIDASREIVATYGNEDPLEFGKQWGMIQNSHVKVREFAFAWRLRVLIIAAENWTTGYSPSSPWSCETGISYGDSAG